MILKKKQKKTTTKQTKQQQQQQQQQINQLNINTPYKIKVFHNWLKAFSFTYVTANQDCAFINPLCDIFLGMNGAENRRSYSFFQVSHTHI